MLRRVVVMLLFGTMLLAACGRDEAEDAAPVGGEDADVGAIDAARCAELVQAMAAAAAAPQAATGGAADLEQSIEQLEAFAAAAPEEIRDDVQTIAEGYAEIADVFRDAGFDPASGEPLSAETIAALTAAAERLQTPEFQGAVDRVSAYFDAECQG